MASVRACTWLLPSALIALGCSSDPAVTPDAGNPVDVQTINDVQTPDVQVADVPVDMGRPPRNPQPLYGPCDSDSECRDEMTCRRAADTGYPGGQCNRECTRDDDCVLFSSGGAKPVDGFCQAADAAGHRYCGRVCANGIDCERDGYTCFGINQGTIRAVNICIPVCTETSCIDGTVCNHETGRCRPADAPPLTGRTLGQSCVATSDTTMTPATVCQSGLCNPQIVRDSAGNPVQTGDNGGNCIGRCILPQGYNSSNLWTDPELPQSNCPEGGVCFLYRTYAEGDMGLCQPGCTQDSDCRVSEGYGCRRTFRVSATRTRTFTRGYCAPIDCVAPSDGGVTADAGVNRTCPSGYSCVTRTSGTTTTSRCLPTT